MLAKMGGNGFLPHAAGRLTGSLADHAYPVQAAPPVYRPQNAIPAIQRAKAPGNLALERRPAPPVYCAKAVPASSIQSKSFAGWTQPEKRPAPPVYRPQAPSRVQLTPGLSSSAPRLSGRSGAPPIYRPAPMQAQA